MNKIVKCPACGEGYNLDLDKYGGKKIKCKKCQGIIAVPTAAEAQDEFEVVEDAPPVPTAKATVPTASVQRPLPSVPVPANAPPLQRHRMASQRGAVNIALLQRGEASREEIRNAFLSVHGSYEARAAPIAELQRQLKESQSATGQPQEKLTWLKDVLARALGSDPRQVGPNLTKPKVKIPGFLKQFARHGESLDKDGDEDAYSYALGIMGKPVREMREMPQSFLTGIKELERQKAEERAIKIDTIKVAIQAFEGKNQALEATESVRRHKLQQQIAAFMQSHKAKFDHALAQVADGRLSEATVGLQEMLKAAPVAMLGEVLVALSKCTYWSGNASDAARHIQDAICFGASAPVDMDEAYNGLWAKASAGLPKV